MYKYHLPCGQVFNSHVKSVEDKEAGGHWFPCRRCKITHLIPDSEVEMTPPPCAKNQGLDEAIRKDRVVAEFRAQWCGITIKELVERHGLCVRTVEAISAAVRGHDCMDRHDFMID